MTGSTPPAAGQQLHPRHGKGSSTEDVGGSAAARVTVVAPLPLLTAQLDTPDVVVVPPPAPPPPQVGPTPHKCGSRLHAWSAG